MAIQYLFTFTFCSNFKVDAVIPDGLAVVELDEKTSVERFDRPSFLNGTDDLFTDRTFRLTVDCVVGLLVQEFVSDVSRITAALVVLSAFSGRSLEVALTELDTAAI